MQEFEAHLTALEADGTSIQLMDFTDDNNQVQTVIEIPAFAAKIYPGPSCKGWTKAQIRTRKDDIILKRMKSKTHEDAWALRYYVSDRFSNREAL